MAPRETKILIADNQDRRFFGNTIHYVTARCCGLSGCDGLLRRKDKDLARIDPVGIADLLPVRPVNDCVASARAICDAA
jgi:hypothetical protein